MSGLSSLNITWCLIGTIMYFSFGLNSDVHDVDQYASLVFLAVPAISAFFLHPFIREWLLLTPLGYDGAGMELAGLNGVAFILWPFFQTLEVVRWGLDHTGNEALFYVFAGFVNIITLIGIFSAPKWKK